VVAYLFLIAVYIFAIALFSSPFLLLSSLCYHNIFLVVVLVTFFIPVFSSLLLHFLSLFLLLTFFVAFTFVATLTIYFIFVNFHYFGLTIVKLADVPLKLYTEE